MEGCLFVTLFMVLVAQSLCQITVPPTKPDANNKEAHVDAVHSSLSMVELEKEVKVMKEEIESLKKWRQNATHVVAFSAGRTSVDGLGKNQIVRFDTIYLNLGESYNPKTGIFTCPFSGLYFIQFSFMNADAKTTELRLMHNGAGTIGVATYAHANGKHQASNGRVLLCEEGEQVWVTNLSTSLNKMYSVNLCTFSGFLIHKRDEKL